VDTRRGCPLRRRISATRSEGGDRGRTQPFWARCWIQGEQVIGRVAVGSGASRFIGRDGTITAGIVCPLAACDTADHRLPLSDLTVRYIAYCYSTLCCASRLGLICWGGNVLKSLYRCGARWPRGAERPGPVAPRPLTAMATLRTGRRWCPPARPGMVSVRESGEFVEPAGHLPVAFAEQCHGGGKQDSADDGGVDEDRGGEPTPSCLKSSGERVAKIARTATMTAAACSCAVPRLEPSAADRQALSNPVIGWTR
jgi:hypothetical protein